MPVYTFTAYDWEKIRKNLADDAGAAIGARLAERVQQAERWRDPITFSVPAALAESFEETLREMRAAGTLER